MSAAAPLPLKVQLGARTLVTLRPWLLRVALSLDDVREGRVLRLPPLEEGAAGYLVTSLPEVLLQHTRGAASGMIAFVRQRYTRYHADLTGGFDAYLAQLSSNTRQGLKRKAKKLGTLDVRRFRTPDEMEAFHRVARALALTTYQERLMGAGLPDDPGFVAGMLSDAATENARGWLLFIDGEPAAYLYCPIRSGVALYEYVGHDPHFNALSPGAVLQLEAMRDLASDARVTAFDFTEGEGQHKRAMATGGTACVDVLLLRPTLANRAMVAGLRGFNGGVALAKSVVARAGLQDWARRVRRG